MTAYAATITALRTRMVGIEDPTLRTMQRDLQRREETRDSNEQLVAIGTELLARDLVRFNSNFAFFVGERLATLRELVRDNAHDPALCRWARLAKVGDIFPSLVHCERVS